MNEYLLINAFYGDRVAKRSGVPLINHIEEGLSILEQLNASEDTKRAFCLHPMFQKDEDLLTQASNLIDMKISARVILIVMEYRNQANKWLSDKVWFSRDGGGPHFSGSPTPGPLLEVRHMLIADKVQNYRDFVQYHLGTHERSEELNHYFLAWFSALNIVPDDYV